MFILCSKPPQTTLSSSSWKKLQREHNRCSDALRMHHIANRQPPQVLQCYELQALIDIFICFFPDRLKQSSDEKHLTSHTPRGKVNSRTRAYKGKSHWSVGRNFKAHYRHLVMKGKQRRDWQSLNKEGA